MSDGIQFYLYFAGKNDDYAVINEESTCLKQSIDDVLAELKKEYPIHLYWVFDDSDSFFKRWKGWREIKRFYKRIGGM